MTTENMKMRHGEKNKKRWEKQETEKERNEEKRT